MQFHHSPAERVFYYFHEICQIPHGSGNTKAVSDYCVQFAKEHGLEYYQDSLNNVIIIREAAKGYEDHKPYIIQGHLDMVCEKDADRTIDFEKEGLDLYEEQGYLKARGTTLGADDGIAIAYGLALLEKEDLKSPRLEVVFTVDEETGMYGAKGIDLSVLKGRELLNLDSEEEGIFLCGCAGGMRARAEFSFTREIRSGILAVLTLTGLHGGHSGSEIQKEYGNAIQLMGRVLKELEQLCHYSLIHINGGLKDNAIPREASAEILLSEDNMDSFHSAVSHMESILHKEYENTDPELKLSASVKKAETSEHVMAKQGKHQILTFLYTMPNGVQHMSTDLYDLVETSLNAGIMTTSENHVQISFSIRSSVSSRKRLLADQIRLLTESLLGCYTEDGEYPAWEYRKDSLLRKRLIQVYEELFNQRPKVEAIHAGLECGLFLEKLPDLDCVSLGPQIDDIHTPSEKLSIASTEKIWKFLLEFLKKGNL
ncbi:Cytosol non-specific dipeptidase [uncultured Roseburia sp.]|uniref:Aminoacyl-histidine dipeptidase n=1 Tax=Brotonthovivens ammoniilytica TaxID=2981725 RepID=A0ABT2TGG0_9FIRM|nr:aminoacyl-histidine dipeptidase [Brotonthovivens ammoniilytica]MCU6761274.1 aminoacyl-histidine dipeptidase [Brotonthovivens ammoniilytica]SCI23996.1 Cytosol non-specific dipeptidase [uncultured Roseburia sp.]